ncbi:precorrin-2 dehydrogenase/sirohydrochlorin ferrochelatase [Enterococcus sp. PF1-24]|uniref:precorrin-2 dehydrogenase/sirohydrochlorin ferrochelatase family protein n=1 Tax=unclassified Enterococcus TaxID=2608891 RepID=UPI0024771434|nr:MULTISPECIES: bifunctional precorrin-2 dehydrogenase/sirohydrochlorin ferrochelatase [unclassified Enterococcus]MDH6363374.1 precorrin-2 dehydrogenase/sirohydrochlorin ferrochelatase [Enterococcus sp. PFB1-1]MDH6400325.1 precorrin-2 dehydrogenase/sirohydrochlorin ferrochelatase [Enterococcus sp. PF1-24]
MYPIMMNVRNKTVVVVGGGKVATRKIKLLLAEGAKITVISPSLSVSISAEKKVTWIQRKYQTGDLAEAALIFACTNHDEVNQQVLADATDSQWVNVTSDKHISEFYNMATTQVNDLSISVSTGGASPMRAKKIRQMLEEYLKELEI